MEIKSHERENIQNHFFYVLNYKDLLSGLNLGGGGEEIKRWINLGKLKLKLNYVDGPRFPKDYSGTMGEPVHEFTY